MLRRLLRDSEAAKALFEKLGMFKDPELLEKYVIASEVTVEVLDLLFCRVFGSERAPIGNASGDLSPLLEGLFGLPLSEERGAPGEDSSARDEATEGLHARVNGLERQLCALQRQLQMQGEASKVAAAVEGRLAEVADEWQRRICETSEAVRGDVASQVSAVSGELDRLKSEVGERARNGDVRALSEEVAQLKKELGDRLSAVEKKASDGQALGEIRKKIEELEHGVNMVPQGIIGVLTRQCGGNVQEKGVVEVTASSCWIGEPKNVVELGTNWFFWSKDESNSWICYDFKERRVAPTSYSIRTDCSRFPKSWVLEVSNGGSWTVVDRRENNEDLNGEYVTRNFALSAPPSGRFRFVRLRQTGKTHGGRDILILASLEVFGTLSPQ